MLKTVRIYGQNLKILLAFKLHIVEGLSATHTLPIFVMQLMDVVSCCPAHLYYPQRSDFKLIMISVNLIIQPSYT